MTDIVVHSASLVFGLGERGLVDILRLRGVRRPATNRLSAGGFLAVSLRGGSLHMRDSELSYNFDDLTDVQSGLAYAFEQVMPSHRLPRLSMLLHMRVIPASQGGFGDVSCRFFFQMCHGFNMHAMVQE